MTLGQVILAGAIYIVVGFVLAYIFFSDCFDPVAAILFWPYIGLVFIFGSFICFIEAIWKAIVKHRKNKKGNE